MTRDDSPLNRAIVALAVSVRLRARWLGLVSVGIGAVNGGRFLSAVLDDLANLFLVDVEFGATHADHPPNLKTPLWTVLEILEI